MIDDQRVSMAALVIAGKEFTSRLFIGTGKYASNAVMAESIRASGTQMVTVALRRVDIENKNDDMLAAIDLTKYQLLPNTSGARDAAEAIRLARLARAASQINWIKLEVTPDPYYLLPDGTETLNAAEIIVKDCFVVLQYIHADPILAKRLQEVGCATVMPLASPIGSNQGLRMKDSIAIIIEQAMVPVVVDAGLGAPSHAAQAMKWGPMRYWYAAIAAAADRYRWRLPSNRPFGPGGWRMRRAWRLKHSGNRFNPLTGFLRDEE